MHKMAPASRMTLTFVKTSQVENCVLPNEALCRRPPLAVLPIFFRSQGSGAVAARTMSELKFSSQRFKSEDSTAMRASPAIMLSAPREKEPMASATFCISVFTEVRHVLSICKWSVATSTEET